MIISGIPQNNIYNSLSGFAKKTPEIKNHTVIAEQQPSIIQILRDYIANKQQNITLPVIEPQPTIPTPTPTEQPVRVLTIDFDDTDQVKYDLDGNEIEETIHSDVTGAGIKVYADDNTQIQVNKIANDFEALSRELELVKTKVLNKEIDAMYLALGLDLTLAEISELLGSQADINFLRTKQGAQALRDNLFSLDNNGTNVYRKIFNSITEIQKHIPLYISAGNDPDKINILVFAEGENIKSVGSPSEYSSPVYNTSAQSDYNWVKQQNGWDINGDGDVELLFSENMTEGQSLPNGTTHYLEGGTSLGVAVALGKDIADGIIKNTTVQAVA